MLGHDLPERARHKPWLPGRRERPAAVVPERWARRLQLEGAKSLTLEVAVVARRLSAPGHPASIDRALSRPVLPGLGDPRRRSRHREGGPATKSALFPSDSETR